MKDIFAMLDELDHKKLILYLNREKDVDIITMLNTKISGNINVPLIGKVSNLNTVQYLLARMIMEDENMAMMQTYPDAEIIDCNGERVSQSASFDMRDDFWRSLLIVMKNSNVEIYNNKDSNGNNVLHYCGVFGDYELTKTILDADVAIEENSMKQHAYHLCKDVRTKNLLRNWTKIIDDEVIFVDNDNNYERYHDKVRKEPYEDKSLETNLFFQHIQDDQDYRNDISCNSTGIREDLSVDVSCDEKISNEKDSLGNIINNNKDNNSEFPESNIKRVNSDSENKNEHKSFSNDYNVYNESIESPLDEENRILDKRPGLDSDREDFLINLDPLSQEIIRYGSFLPESPNENNLDNNKGHLISRKRMQEITSEVREIKKYPGALYIYIGNIVGYFCERNDIEGVVLKIEYGDKIIETEVYSTNTHIEIDKLIEFDIKNAKAKIDIFMYVKFKKESIGGLLFRKKILRKVLYTSLVINTEVIDRIHNNLVQRDLNWKKYKTGSLIKAFKDNFSPKLPRADLLSCHISFISENEFQYVNAPKPKDISTLSHWLRYRKNSFNKWYSGYVNIRGEDCCIATHLWKRRFIQWNGYVIKVYNESSGMDIGQIDVTDSKFKICSKDGKNTHISNAFKLFLNEGNVEFQFDNREKYEASLDALAHLLNC